ncbi:hypothetical protein FRC07_000208 [Ceratobasidium sp. 392]|nr:hypothetical protein FRC07_000208 [Ceratobasidium sp. 392]
MVRHSTPSPRRSPRTLRGNTPPPAPRPSHQAPLRRSPRQATPPRRPITPPARQAAPRQAPPLPAAPRQVHQPAAPRQATPPPRVEPIIEAGLPGFDMFYRSRRNILTNRMQCGALQFRTIPEQFNPFANPFVNNAMWSFSPRSGVARISTVGRKIGDIHFSILPGDLDATFYVCVPGAQNQLRWIEAERGFRHPLYSTHALYQRGKSVPRWVPVRTYKTYVRVHGGRIEIFVD